MFNDQHNDSIEDAFFEDNAKQCVVIAVHIIINDNAYVMLEINGRWEYLKHGLCKEGMTNTVRERICNLKWF